MQAHACLTEEETIVMTDWAHGRSIASTAMRHNMSESKVQKIRSKIRQKYDGIQSYTDLPPRKKRTLP
jgi:DNA-binding CsgD family transcriptional regulator